MKWVAFRFETKLIYYLHLFPSLKIFQVSGFRFIYFHSIKPNEVNHRKLHVNEIYKDVNKVKCDTAEGSIKKQSL